MQVRVLMYLEEKEEEEEEVQLVNTDLYCSQTTVCIGWRCRVSCSHVHIIEVAVYGIGAPRATSRTYMYRNTNDNDDDAKQHTKAAPFRCKSQNQRLVQTHHSHDTMPVSQEGYHALVVVPAKVVCWCTV